MEGVSPADVVKIMVNGSDIDVLSGLDTVLEDGDEIFLFPPVGGGWPDV
ncbi:molybdopterin synthase sulfur carrier subunit, partial [Candidatus Bathyarchaeota archaeon]